MLYADLSKFALEPAVGFFPLGLNLFNLAAKSNPP